MRANGSDREAEAYGTTRRSGGVSDAAAADSMSDPSMTSSTKNHTALGPRAEVRRPDSVCSAAGKSSGIQLAILGAMPEPLALLDECLAAATIARQSRNELLVRRRYNIL